MMAYPNRTHSISEGDGTRRHLFELMTRFLEQSLPAGAYVSGMTRVLKPISNVGSAR